MKLRLFLIVVLMIGCSSNGEMLCDGELTVIGAIPADESQGIALDAKPVIVLDNGSKCDLVPTAPAAVDMTLKKNGLPVDGKVERKLVGLSETVTFVPSAPLEANSSYTMASGQSQFTFSTSDVTASAPPTTATVKSISAIHHVEGDYELHVSAAVGVEDPVMVHLIPTYENGKPVTVTSTVDNEFVVPASSPYAEAYGRLDLEGTGSSRICYAAQTENLAGVLSALSAPSCVDQQD